jgi:hypothetical protein
MYGDSSVFWLRSVDPVDPLKVGSSLLSAGRWHEAFEIIQPLARSGSGPARRLQALLAIAAARAGRLQLADSLRLAFAADTVTTGAVWAVLYQAQISASMGRATEAVSLLRRVVERGLTPAEVLHSAAGLELLQGDPAFEQILRPIDEPAA